MLVFHDPPSVVSESTLTLLLKAPFLFLHPYQISEDHVSYRWQQFLIDNFVGYDTILTNSLLSACGRGTNGILPACFLFSIVPRVGL